MDNVDNYAMNGDDAWNGITAEGCHQVPQESGKDTTLPKEGGNTARKEGK